MQATTVRTLKRLEVVEEGEGCLRIEMEGDGFLYRMCRKIASLLVECGAGRLSVDECMDLVRAGVHKRTPKAAPPQGLKLIQIHYRNPAHD